MTVRSYLIETFQNFLYQILTHSFKDIELGLKFSLFTQTGERPMKVEYLHITVVVGATVKAVYLHNTVALGAVLKAKHL